MSHCRDRSRSPLARTLFVAGVFSGCLAPKYSEVDSFGTHDKPSSKPTSSGGHATTSMSRTPAENLGGALAAMAGQPSESSVGPGAGGSESNSSSGGGSEATTSAGTFASGSGGTSSTSEGVTMGGTSAGTGASLGGATSNTEWTFAEPPSCKGGLTCNDEESCCMAIEMAGSDVFPRGRKTESCSGCLLGCPPDVRECANDETPETPVKVSAFKLDKYLVTVGRMKNFLVEYDDFRRAQRPGPSEGLNPSNVRSDFKSGWAALLPTNAEALKSQLRCSVDKATFDDTGNTHDKYPINCVTWAVAFAFCVWDGGRLPSELEWEFAAAGGTENRVYPWGSAAPTADHSRSGGATGTPFVNVGSYLKGEGRFYHLDLVGLLFQWNYDLYDSNYYVDSTDCADCSNYSLSVGQRVVRGGTYASTQSLGFLRAARRFFKEAAVTTASDANGVRCAR